MRAICVVLIAVYAAVSVAAEISSKPTQLAIDGCEFGEAYSFTTAECQLTATNSGDAEIRVFGFHAVKAGGSVEPSQLVVAPHATAYARATVDTQNSAGRSRYAFQFQSDEPGHPAGAVNVRGFVLSTLDEPRPAVDFGVVNLDAQADVKTVQLASHEIVDFKILSITEAPEWLTASIAPSGREVGISVKPTAKWGLQNGFVKVRINTPKQNEAWISVKADIHGDVVPSANPVDLGLMRLGNRNESIVRLTSKSGKDFKLGKLTLQDVLGSVDVLPCKPKAKGCQMVRVVISDKQPSGSVQGKLLVDLPDEHQQFPVALWGLLVSKDFKVQTLDPAKEGSVGGDKSAVVGAKTDVADTLKQISKQSAAASLPPPPGDGPLLKWAVANGSRLYGFQIFRSNGEQGPFLLVNPSPVPSATEGNDTVAYQWRDNTAESGKTYWYYVGTVDTGGNKQQLSGPQRVVAK